MRRNAIVAAAIVVMMVAATMPLMQTGSLDASATGNVEDVPGVSLVDNGDGSYTLDSEYLEDVFGIKNSAPSDVDDPVGSNAIGISPLELVYWYGGSDSEYAVRDVSSPDIIRDDRFGHSTDSNHAVAFSAALTRNNGGMHTVSDQNSPWNQSGFEKQDWYCNIYYDNGTGHLMLAVGNGTDYSSLSVDTSAGTTPYPIDQINQISSIQSRNILNYAIGDFDGDGNEEIAVHHWFGVYVFGLEQTDLKLMLEGSYSVPRYDGYDNSLFTPVSMAAGDIDYDGEEEILITRGYYKNGVPGTMEFTDLGIIGTSDRPGGEWIRLTVKDPKNSESTLDSVMTSVSSGDVDNDGEPEIVIGGYLWDNTNTSKSYTEYWGRSAGELYLAYIDPTDSSRQIRGLTILGDDNGTATTRYISNDSDFSKKYSLNDHSVADTSIYLTDNNDNPSGLCRSVNWCNWTIPLGTGSLGGYENGSTMDEVYFDRWFYKLESGSFGVYKTTPQLTKVMDNNNVICVGIDVGQITTTDASGFNGTEEFMVFYAADLHKDYDNGDTEWVFVIYGNSDGREANRTYSVDMPSPYRDLRGWGLYNVGRIFMGNYDNDTYYVDFQARLFTYTDPTVIAVIAPVPYDQDLASVLIGGSDAIGSTDFTRYTSHETSSESTCNFEIGPCGGIDAIVRADLQLKYTHDESWSNSKSITLSTSYSSSHEAVAAYVIPTDMYFYKVYTPVNGEYEESFQYMSFYRDPVQTIFDYDEYCSFIDNYNRIMRDFSGSEYIDIPKVSMSDNIEGDITSYTSSPANPLETVSVYYKGSGNSSHITQSVDLSESTGRTWANGGYVDLAVQAKIAFGLLSVGGEFSLGGTLAKSETDVSGMAFSSSLAQGMEVSYLGETSEARSVLSQFSMTGSLWAELRSMDMGGVQQDYVYVGYTVHDYTSGPMLGTIAPDVYIPGGDDDDDPYNPTDDEIYLQVTIPDSAGRGDRAADRYEVQFQWQGFWYTLDGSRLGFQAYLGDEESGWTPIDGKLSTDAGTFWVKVDGLSNVSNTDFRFRIDAVRDDMGGERHNPSLPVTGYKDTRITSSPQIMMSVGRTVDPVDYGIYDSGGRTVLLVDSESVHNLSGHILMYVHTDLEPGELVDLWFYDEDAKFTKLAERLGVYTDGYVVYEFGKPVPEPDSTPMIVVSAALLVAGLAFIVAFNKRR